MRPKRPRKPPPTDNGSPPFPYELEYLWDWFGELSAGLAVNGMAPPVVTWQAIRAWRKEVGIGRLQPWESRTLIELGMLRAKVQSEKAK